MQNFDFNEALKAIQSGKPITGSVCWYVKRFREMDDAYQ